MKNYLFQYKEHTRKCLENQKVTCTVCDKVFDGKLKLKNHKIIHMEDTKCKVCNKNMAASSIYKHMKRERTTPIHHPPKLLLICVRQSNQGD